MFGTQMTDEFFAVHTGGDLAFLNGVLKVLLADGRRRPRLRARPHRGVRRAASRELERESFDDLERQSGATRADMERFARHVRRRRASAVARLVDGHHPARARRRQRRRDREPRARPRQRRAPGRRAHAHPRPLGGAGRLPRWAPTPPRSPAASTIDAANAARARRAVRVPGRRPARHHRRGDGRSRRARRDRRPLLVGRQLPRGAARSRRRSTHALARVPLRVHQDIVRVEPDARRPRRGRGAAARGALATSSATAAPRPPPSAGSRSAPRSRARDRVRCAASGRSSSTSRGASRPERAHQLRLRVGPGDPRRDRARRSRCTRASSCSRTTGDAIQWGGTRLCEGGAFPTPDGTGALPRRSRPSERRRARRELRAQHPAGQAVQHDGARAERDPLTGAMRDALFMAAVRHPRRSALRDGDRVLVRSDHGEMRARLHESAAAARQRAGVLPRGQRAAAAPAGAIRRRACPTTTRSSPWSRAPVTPDAITARRAARALRRRQPPRSAARWRR